MDEEYGNVSRTGCQENKCQALCLVSRVADSYDCRLVSGMADSLVVEACNRPLPAGPSVSTVSRNDIAALCEAGG